MNYKNNILGLGITFIVLLSIFPNHIWAQTPPIPSNPIPNLPPYLDLPPVPTTNPALNSKETGIQIFGVSLPGVSWDGIAINIAKASIEGIVDSTVEWINSGFNGNPAYISNPEQYFTDLSDGIAGDFINATTSPLSFLCSPFQAQIKLALLKSYSRAPQFQCTLTSVIGNIEAFYDDFSQGGWDAWFSMTQNNQNNPYGAYIEAKIELDSRISQTLGIKKEQLDWGKGFLSTEKCPEGEELDPLLGTGDCRVEKTIVTPGTVIESQLEHTLGSGLRQLELADEFDELIGALLGQLLNKSVFNNDGLFKAPKVDSGRSTTTPPTPPGGGGACADPGNTVADYEGAVDAAESTVLSNNPALADSQNDAPAAEQFVNMVIAELQSMGYQSSHVLSGNGVSGKANKLAVWLAGDTLIERYEVVDHVGDGTPGETIAATAISQYTGDIPLSCQD